MKVYTQILFALVAVCLLAQSVIAQSPEPISMPLWPQGPPDDNGLPGIESGDNCIAGIAKPTLTIHLPDPDKATGAAVVITPGGGYGVVCTESEGTDIADLLVPRGIAAIVLKYRLPNQHHLIPSGDARRAIRTVRNKAGEWSIKPDNIGVWGFSAGGHLASTVSTAFDVGDEENSDAIEKQSSRPDFSILFYPVISMENGVTHGGSRNNLLGPNATAELVNKYSNEHQVTDRTPPTFMLHAADDRVVSLDNSFRYYKQLVAHGVPARLVVFETGGHGPNAFNSNPSWLAVFEEWLEKR